MQVKNVVDEDRRRTIREMSEETGLSYASVQKILTVDLNMRHLSARWVPRILSEHEMKTRFAHNERFLKRYKQQGQQFLDRIITTDETWLYDPEMKQQSSQWKNADPQPPKKARASRCMGKHMFIVFFDCRGLLLCHTVPFGMTVNAKHYLKVWIIIIIIIITDCIRTGNHLYYSISGNLSEPTYGIMEEATRCICRLGKCILHQDNAPKHRAVETQTTITIQLGAEVFEHPPYSPDLAPCDFSLFPKLKVELKGHRFIGFHDFQTRALAVLHSFDASFYKNIFSQWVQRHEQCVEVRSAYFEKM